MSDTRLTEAEEALQLAIDEGIVEARFVDRWNPDDVLAWYEKQLAEEKGEEIPF